MRSSTKRWSVILILGYGTILRGLRHTNRAVCQCHSRASREPEGHNAICLVLATTRLDVNGAVRRHLGVRKVSFAPGEPTRELTGQEIGGKSVFGTHSGLPIWVDSRVLDHRWMIISAGSRTAEIKLNPKQLRALDGFEIVEDLAKTWDST